MREFTVAVERALQGWSADTLAFWGLVSIGACTALYVLTSLALPFGWDHDIIASVGSSYVHGRLPYVNSWDIPLK